MRESESRYLGQILLLFGHGFKHIQPEACLIVTKVLFIDWNRSFLNFFLFFLTSPPPLLLLRDCSFLRFNIVEEIVELVFGLNLILITGL